MTASRAPAEPEVREFEATVESVDDRAIVLDETYFYAESGGQPADRGTIDGILLADVIERDGRVVHILDQDAETLPRPARRSRRSSTTRSGPTAPARTPPHTSCTARHAGPAMTSATPASTSRRRRFAST